MIEATVNANGQYDGYQEYQGFKNANESGAAVRTENFVASGIDNGTIIKFKSSKLYTRPITDSNGNPRVHTGGRFQGKPMVSASFLVEQIDAQGNHVKDLFIPANFLERIAYEWTKNEATKKFVRGVRREGTGVVNQMFTSVGDKDIALSRIIEEQANHKGIQVSDIVVTTAPYVEGGKMTGKVEVPTEGEDSLFQALTTTHLYSAVWFD